jgi:cytochrome c oxidase subunit 2
MACGATSQPEKTPEAGQNSGEQIFQSLGCSGCHVNAAGQAAPSLQGLFGGEVQLENGETLIADEQYLLESIRSPNVKIVRGYQPIMPDFKDQITDDQLKALIEYIRSLEN